MELREGYKRTEVGVIPEDWEVINFGDLVNYTKGYAFKSSEYLNDGVRVIRVSDTTYDSIEDDGAVFVSDKSAKRYKKWCLRENDLIFSTVGSKPPMYDSLVGKVILVSGEYSGSLLNQNAVLIRAKKYSDPSQQLLLNHFRTDRYIHYIEIIFRGNANQASITLVDLFKYKIPLPPTKTEQTAIANALSDADALIQSLTRLIVKKRQIKQGAMQTLLNPYGNGFLKAGWVEAELVEIAELATGNTPPTSDKSNYGGKFLFVSPADLGKGKWITDTEKKLSGKGFGLARKFPVNSILFTCIGSTIGKAGMASVGLTSNQQINAVFPNNNFSSEYLYYFLVLMAPIIQASASEQAIPIINKTQFGETKVYFPSNKAEQTRIATILSDMDADIAALETKLAKTLQIKQGMMQNLLTGRIRLIKAEEKIR